MLKRAPKNTKAPTDDLANEKLRKEIELLEIEIRTKRNPFWQPTVIVALCGIFAVGLGYGLQSYYQHKQFEFEQSLEKKKFEYEIIQKSSELGDYQKIVRNLDFYIAVGYLPGTPHHYQNLLDLHRLEGIPNFTKVSVFNTAPNDLGTVMVSNHNTNPCNAGKANGCWVDSTQVKAGDTVGVQIYFHNCSNVVARAVVVGLLPQISTQNTIHLFRVVLAEDSGIIRSAAKCTSITPTKLTFIPGSIRIYRNQSVIGAGIPLKNENYLFGQFGLDIGNINPGWDGQGVLVADFITSGK